MEPHEQLSVNIAGSDLLYVVGMALSTGDHPRSSPLVQWGTMIAFETQKHLRDVHGVTFELDWEPTMAEAARHGGKFFDGRGDPIHTVSGDFEALAEATHLAFFPADRLGPAFDFLRDDLAVITVDEEVVLTNVTGHFMLGLASDSASSMDNVGPRVMKLSSGIGQLASSLLNFDLDTFRQHGQLPSDEVKSWDATMTKAMPSTFGGELKSDLAFAVIGILSTVQAARRWARTECCVSCAGAALKHRFVVLHHALRSMQKLAERAMALGPIASERVIAVAEGGNSPRMTDSGARALRNGWLHLGLGDVAALLPPDPTPLSPIEAYTGIDLPEFARMVDEELVRVALGLSAWLRVPGRDGSDLFDHLRPPPAD